MIIENLLVAIAGGGAAVVIQKIWEWKTAKRRQKRQIFEDLFRTHHIVYEWIEAERGDMRHHNAVNHTAIVFRNVKNVDAAFTKLFEYI